MVPTCNLRFELYGVGLHKLCYIEGFPLERYSEVFVLSSFIVQ